MVDSLKAGLEFGAPAMDTIITLTETMVLMEAIVAMPTNREMSSVNVRISACGCWYPTHFPRTTPARRLSNKKKYRTYRPCCVLFTNKPTHVKSYKRHLVISRKTLVSRTY